jgi:RNA polymerase sigma-70 factor (ECF subfamily)
LAEPSQHERFETLMLPHLDAAYALALWLTRDEAQAADAVQEAFLRALRFFGSFRGGEGRPWLLKIVRNACYELLQREHASMPAAEFDEESVDAESAMPGAVVVLPVNPETAVIERADRDLVHRCLRALPCEYREALVLRELQGCTYREIAAIAGIPIGTVMSRLARGRRLLQARICESVRREDTGT